MKILENHILHVKKSNKNTKIEEDPVCFLCFFMSHFSFSFQNCALNFCNPYGSKLGHKVY